MATMDADQQLEVRDSQEDRFNGAIPIKRARLELDQNQPNAAALRKRKEANLKYGRGAKIPLKSIKDKKLRGNLKNLENKYQTATLRAKDAEILHEHTEGFLEPENEVERTFDVTQKDIQAAVSIETAKKRFDLKLDELGPYIFDYSRNGCDLLLAGRKGHVATMDWREGKLGCELQLRETVRDVKWLHNNQMFVVAQKKYVYIYDSQGVELHCLKNQFEVSNMEFLPYHYLLATLALDGKLRYQDTSTGQMVTTLRTGFATALAQNPQNAILHVGNTNGTVSLWSPNSQTPLVKLLAHSGSVRAIAVDREGRYMVTTGQDTFMNVWDLRMFKEVNRHQLTRPGTSIAISDRNVTAINLGSRVEMRRGLFSKELTEQEKIGVPYMKWGQGQDLERVRWCPFEDVLGISHDKGFSSVIVPGAGEPNFDASEINPYETTKQRQETEIRSLLNKLQPEMISLDPDYIGNLDLVSADQRQAERDAEKGPVEKIKDTKDRKRGKNSALSKHIRNKGLNNIIDEKSLQAEELRKSQEEKQKKELEAKKEELGPALGRFARKAL